MKLLYRLVERNLKVLRLIDFLNWFEKIYIDTYLKFRKSEVHDLFFGWACFFGIYIYIYRILFDFFMFEFGFDFDNSY